MEEKEAKRLYSLLLENGIQIWVVGGWGIDALNGEQTRPHKDLDVIMHADDIFKTCQILQGEGYARKDLWSENSSIQDSFGNTIDTAFVLLNSQEYGLDVHAVSFDSAGNGIPAWVESEDFIFSHADLSGHGKIGGMAVQCITVKSQIACHSGYSLPDYQIQDMALLYNLLEKDEG